MPTDDDYIIRNGTLYQWLKYRVKFGTYSVAGFFVLGVCLLAAALAGAIFV